ncbi:hypothetical protein M2150_001649 [Lachnospiraceae bacterium PM6-15]|uniref:hypothetical protein n=1 Tax=Ohessyouella blattaphilus TaxID=2949333 RepID=UPI003E2CD83B
MAMLTREMLERIFLGSEVSVRLYDGITVIGTLHKTGEEAFKHNPNLYVPRGRYFLTDRDGNLSGNIIFRVSHIKRISRR